MFNDTETIYEDYLLSSVEDTDLDDEYLNKQREVLSI